MQIVSDNGTEIVNKVVRVNLAKLTIDHVLTSAYHPQSNAKVQRFHSTLHDILAKMVADDQQHKSFVHERNHSKKAKKRPAKYASKGSKADEFQVGDTVYNKKNKEIGK